MLGVTALQNSVDHGLRALGTFSADGFGNPVLRVARVDEVLCHVLQVHADDDIRVRIRCQYAGVFDYSEALENNTGMNNSSFPALLKQLLDADPRVKRLPNGELNVAHAAELMGMNQPTLARMLDGKSAQPRPANLEKITAFLGITAGQLVGTEPIDCETSQRPSEGVRVRLTSDEIRERAQARPREFVVGVVRALIDDLTLEDRLEIVRLLVDSKTKR